MNKIRFDNFVSLNRGFDLPDDKIIEGEYPVIASTSIKAYHNKFKIKAPIVVTGRSGSLGKVQYIDKDGWPLNTVLYAKDYHGNLPKYIYYFLQTMHLEQYNAGAGVPTLNQNHLHSLKLLIHEKKEQKIVSDILSRYDEAIENNNKRIKLLEQMAQNLYKEWFVRFRFPGWQNAEFENGIPKGWKVAKVGEYVKIKSGFAFKSEWWQEEGCPVVKIKDIDNGALDISQLDCVSEEHTKKAKSFLLNEGDLVIAMTGATIGKIGLVPKIDNLYTNQRVGKFFFGEKPFERMPLMYCLFSQPATVEMILCLSGASSAQPNISPEQLESIKFFYNDEIAKKFNATSVPIFRMILKLRENNQILSKQRDLLLPRLMSGKLEVK